MEKFLDRFLRYVSVDTKADPESESQPSAARELDLLKMLRDERNLTMEMVVADINEKFKPVKPFNRSMICRWENGDNEPSLENAKILSMYFDVSLDYLIGVTDTRTPSRLLNRKRK